MNLFNTSWTSALSLTLLHSLWQGLLITLLTAVFIKFLSSRSAAIKYLVKTVAFFLLMASSLATFVFLLPSAHTPLDRNPNQLIELVRLSQQSEVLEAGQGISYLKSVSRFLELNQGWIVIGWSIGVLLFSLRFIAGITYLKYLRSQAVQIADEWMQTLHRLSESLGVHRAVQLCESISIQTPIVVGYLKPMVLMPAGLLSGLSTQQVEVILVHELAHIRRHDYLINFLQSLGETIFFFNPFVWVLSSSIRNEREHCCDDIVLGKGYDPQLYVRTLFEIETSRIENQKLALALTGNKNQLLNRIKRIMERSAKNQNGKEKFIPLVLLVLGLVFASWLSISPNEDQQARPEQLAKKIVAADTTKKPVVSSYSRTTVITYDEKGQPHEEIVESIEGEEMPEMMTLPDLDFNIPELDPLPFPDVAVMLPPGFPPEMMNFETRFDTLPEGKYNDERMREFQEKFQQEFKEKFADFYAKNQKEMEKMMKDVQEKMGALDDQWQKEIQLDMDRNREQVEKEIALAKEQMINDDEFQRLKRDHAEAMADARAEMGKNYLRMNEDMVRSAKRQQQNLATLNKEIEEELIKDGYLEKGEKIKTLNIKENNKIEVNGKAINISGPHKAKYERLYQQMTENSKQPRRYSAPE